MSLSRRVKKWAGSMGASPNSRIVGPVWESDGRAVKYTLVTRERITLERSLQKAREIVSSKAMVEIVPCQFTSDGFQPGKEIRITIPHPPWWRLIILFLALLFFGVGCSVICLNMVKKAM